jgi:Tfp pilus assembly protein PilO
MKFLKNYWKVLLAVALLVAAALTYMNYQEELAAHENEIKQINTYNLSLQSKIQKNMKYADVQDELKEATAQVMASRLELYEKFPVEMKEEDQIMYVLYLETIFGTEINFAFSKAQPIVALRDGSQLMGLTLTVNYQTTYEGFQDMINYLATDSRVTSVQFANIRYDAARDMAVGTVTLLLYLIDTDLRDYVGPDVNIPDTGKDNIFN